MTPDAAAAYSLLTAEAVRSRAHRMLAIGLENNLLHLRVDLGHLDDTVDLVLRTIQTNYPSLDIPFHSRWRHFAVEGTDRWAAVVKSTTWNEQAQRARTEFDLVIVSVLLDAGAGPHWRYRDRATGAMLGRSEGLAIASLDMFVDGAFSSRPGEPLRVDAIALQQLPVSRLRVGLQVAGDSPLPGIEGRADLLRRLGNLIVERPDVFGRNDVPRPGGLFDHLAGLAKDGAIPATEILEVVLQQLGPIWPSRLTLGGVSLGDCWHHPLLSTADATNGLMPLHKLSQWLTYSLIEPLQRAGIAVTDIDDLTGLAEYRNGGLFVDTGVLAFRDPTDSFREHDVGSGLVVEWRALTVALLDRIADALHERLGLDASLLPLAKVLEGGTWAAGRLIAREMRADGSPPIRVVSDGTVF